MTIRPTYEAFRAQLVMPAQLQLFDYWVDQAAERAMPDRSDIHPKHFAKLLPGISLLEVLEDQKHLRVRLAGSKLREIYDRDITGCLVEEVERADRRDYWAAAYDRLVREAKPAQGVLVAPRDNKEHLVQYWLRLPMRWRDRRGVGMLLCLDCLQDASTVAQDQMESFSINRIKSYK